jgi:tripartite-type tricarboxylate transporter receptor subunit TctC
VTDTGRGPALQDVPTFTEQGNKFDVNVGRRVVPARTPPAIVERLNHEITASWRWTRRRSSPRRICPSRRFKAAEQVAATVTSDIATWQGLAKTAKLTKELG